MEITAPAHWRCVDFLSDIHLDAAHPATAALWLDWLARTPADAVFLLGDVFEVWVGDDAPDAPDGGFERQCAEALRAAAARLALYIMVGNRDFLMGPALMQRCGATALPDPCVLVLGQQRLALAHGDALCTGDLPYLQFRQMVRSAQWQRDFLSQPLPVRRAMAAHMRAQSEARKQQLPGNVATDATPTPQPHAAAAQAPGLQPGWADVDPQAALALLREQQADTLIHGHTHRPGEVRLAPGQRRLVLSDWDADATPARADVLRWCRTPSSDGWAMTRLNVADPASKMGGST